MVVAITCGLVFFFFRGTDFRALIAALREARWGLVVFATVLTLATYAIRAHRWWVLLLPIGRAGFWNCFQTTVIGFTMIFVAGRLGELARPVLLARRESFPTSATLATIVLERVFDLVTVFFLVGLALAFGAPPPGAEQGEAVGNLRIGGATAFAIGVALLIAMFVSARHPGRALNLVARLLRFVPSRFSEPLLGFIRSFIDGLRILVDGGNLVRSVILSLVLWLNLALGFWLAARAFGVEFAFYQAFLVQGFLVVGVAVPTPGAIGSYHVMCALAMTMLFGASRNVAAAVALVSHAISFVPVTLLGMVFFARAGLSLRQVKDLSRKS